MTTENNSLPAPEVVSSAASPIRAGLRAERRTVAPTRRGRPRTEDRLGLQGHTTTAYPFRDEARRTLGYLRRIVGQSHIPDHATVAVETDRITIEWED